MKCPKLIQTSLVYFVELGTDIKHNVIQRILEFIEVNGAFHWITCWYNFPGKHQSSKYK